MNVNFLVSCLPSIFLFFSFNLPSFPCSFLPSFVCSVIPSFLLPFPPSHRLSLLPPTSLLFSLLWISCSPAWVGTYYGAVKENLGILILWHLLTSRITDWLVCATMLCLCSAGGQIQGLVCSQWAPYQLQYTHLQHKIRIYFHTKLCKKFQHLLLYFWAQLYFFS